MNDEHALPVRDQDSNAPSTNKASAVVESHATWSVEDVAADLLSLYQFILRAYVPDIRIPRLLRIPVPQGWPQFHDHEALKKKLPKDSIVLDLLQHLPYISVDRYASYPYQTCVPEVWLKCICVDYQAERSIEDIVGDCDLQKFGGPLLQSHELLIWQPNSGDGWCLIFDTHDGSVQRRSMTGHLETFRSMSALVRSVKEDFVSMRIVGALETLYSEDGDDHHKETQRRRKTLLEKYHWPSEDFSKAQYIEAVEHVTKENWLSAAAAYTTPEPPLDLTDEPLPYSVDHVANKLLSLYQFLIRMYLNEDWLRIPPPGGWPQITAERYAYLGKHERVIQLLKKLPYISEGFIWSGCECNNYAEFLYQDGEGFLLEPQPCTKIVLGTYRPRDGFCLIFDTLTGEIERYAPMSDLSETYHNIDELVDRWKWDFTTLEVLAYSPSDEVREKIMNSLDKEYATMEAVYRKYGWPTDDYNKEECMQALQDAMDLF